MTYHKVCQGQWYNKVVGYNVEWWVLDDRQDDQDVTQDGDQYDDSQHQTGKNGLPEYRTWQIIVSNLDFLEELSHM